MESWLPAGPSGDDRLESKPNGDPPRNAKRADGNPLQLQAEDPAQRHPYSLLRAPEVWYMRSLDTWWGCSHRRLTCVGVEIARRIPSPSARFLVQMGKLTIASRGGSRSEGRPPRLREIWQGAPAPPEAAQWHGNRSCLAKQRTGHCKQ
jgi:hypothetical protein